MQKIKILFLLFVICAPCSIYAQSKPKRDTSKDKSVIIAKQQAKQKATAQVTEPKRKRTVVKTQKKHNTQVTQATTSATYLRVNQLNDVTKHIGSGSGTETFTVSTDGKAWSVIFLPTWCKATKHSDYFVLSYDANPNHEDRLDWFKVTSDNQEVKVNIRQDAAPLNITSSINFAYLKHNVHPLKERFLEINARVTIKGAKGQKCLVTAFICDEFAKNIKASYRYPKFGLQPSKDLYTVTEITPVSDDSHEYNVNLYFPNNSMRLWKKKNKLNCVLYVYCVSTSSYIPGANYTLPFKAKSKNGNVRTRAL